MRSHAPLSPNTVCKTILIISPFVVFHRLLSKLLQCNYTPCMFATGIRYKQSCITASLATLVDPCCRHRTTTTSSFRVAHPNARSLRHEQQHYRHRFAYKSFRSIVHDRHTNLLGRPPTLSARRTPIVLIWLGGGSLAVANG